MRHFGATHFAVNNDGRTNLPNEQFVRLCDGTENIPSFSQDQLTVIHWSDALPRIDQWTCPGYYRSLYTLARCAKEQNFDKLIYCEWDFFVLNRAMMEEIAAIDHGLIAYWVPRYLFAESNLIICGKEHFQVLLDAAVTNSDKALTTETIAENSFPWTEVRKHRVGDRYPEFREDIPLNADYCAQVPVDMTVLNGTLTRLAWQLCSACGSKIKFDKKGILGCPECEPERFAESDPFELKP